MSIVKKVQDKFIIGFILGAIIFGSIGASAATYYASKDVSYDNSNSKLKSTDVQGAIDELYGLANATKPEDLKKLVVTAGSGLYKDAYEEGRYIYKGGTPNNYIIFNNETWRILSVEADGKIKIVRNETLPSEAWDTSRLNNWSRPSTLNTYLNEEYLNEITANKDKIETSAWNVGLVDSNNTDLNKQVTTDEKSRVWNGKVGLITASEYIRASNNSACKSQNDYYYIQNSSCYNNNSTHNWLHLDEYWWTLSPASNARPATHVLNILTEGYFESELADSARGIRPALYLSSNLTLTGSGTNSEPYKIN